MHREQQPTAGHAWRQQVAILIVHKEATGFRLDTSSDGPTLHDIPPG